MRLTDAAVASLPLAAAAVALGGEILAQTPEWSGVGLGTAAYVAGSRALLVTSLDQADAAAPLVDSLIDAIARAAAASEPSWQQRLRLLGASLQLVAGRPATGAGTVADVITDFLSLRAFTPECELVVKPHPSPKRPITAPTAVAWALGQLVGDVVEYDHATGIRLTVSRGPLFLLDWRRNETHDGEPIQTSPALQRQIDSPTGGRRDARQWRRRGYVSLAADVLGANLTGPRRAEDGSMVASFEMDVRRLTLPIAVVEAGRVIDTTPGWESERGCPSAGSRTTAKIDRIVRAAGEMPGRIIRDGAWQARQVGARTWIARPPDGRIDRLRAVLARCSHDKAVWAAASPHNIEIDGLAILCRLATGIPLDDWLYTQASFERDFPAATAALGHPFPAPTLTRPVLGAHATAYLAVHYGQGWRLVDGQLHLVLRDDVADLPVLRTLGAQSGTMPIGADPAAYPAS